MALSQWFKGVRIAVSKTLLAFLSWSPNGHWNPSHHVRDGDNRVRAALQALGSPALGLLLQSYWPACLPGRLWNVVFLAKHIAGHNNIRSCYWQIRGQWILPQHYRGVMLCSIKLLWSVLLFPEFHHYSNCRGKHLCPNIFVSLIISLWWMPRWN